MTQTKYSLSSMTLAAALLLQIGIPVSLSNFTPAQAETSGSEQQSIQSNWNEFEPPSRGAPGRREPGGTRGPQDNINLTALMPQKNAALTVSEYPSFFFYVPQISTQTSVEFVLYQYVDEKTEKEVYKTTFKTTGQEGIVSLSLPKNANLQPLEIGTNYRWYFSVIVNPQDRAADRVVEGWIKRVPTSNNLANQLKQGSGLAIAEAYKKESLWQDTLATLAELRRANPADSAITNAWTDLLGTVGLGKIAQAPLVEKVALQKAVENSGAQ
jgi:hypothetical protein